MRKPRGGLSGKGVYSPRGGLSTPRDGPPGPLSFTLQARIVGGAPAWAGASFRFPRSPPDPTSRWAWRRVPGAPAKPQGFSPRKGSAAHSASRQRSPWAPQYSSAPGPLKPQGFRLSAHVARHVQVDHTIFAARGKNINTVVKGFPASGSGAANPMSRFPALRPGPRTQPVLHHSPCLRLRPASTGGAAIDAGMHAWGNSSDPESKTGSTPLLEKVSWSSRASRLPPTFSFQMMGQRLLGHGPSLEQS